MHGAHHLVGQDAIQAALVQGCHPAQALQPHTRFCFFSALFGINIL
jgi:hypothetical protein